MRENGRGPARQKKKPGQPHACLPKDARMRRPHGPAPFGELASQALGFAEICLKLRKNGGRGQLLSARILSARFTPPLPSFPFLFCFFGGHTPVLPPEGWTWSCRAHATPVTTPAPGTVHWRARTGPARSAGAQWGRDSSDPSSGCLCLLLCPPFQQASRRQPARAL